VIDDTKELMDTAEGLRQICLRKGGRQNRMGLLALWKKIWRQTKKVKCDHHEKPKVVITYRGIIFVLHTFFSYAYAFHQHTFDSSSLIEGSHVYKT